MSNEKGINLKINPLHNRNYYADIDYTGLDVKNAGKSFEEIARGLDKPLQVMISSGEVSKIAVLEAAGFQCKRKCYEIEAQRQDYIGEDCEAEVLYSYAGEEVYGQCCELMLNRYIMTHEGVSPWTGSKEAFWVELPERVAYFLTDGMVSCFAFVEAEEIAYVYGESLQEFRIFAQALSLAMFRKYETITFEADDCDEMAMELKGLFINQEEESFDTYIREKKCE